ncbi:MAG TPA: MFS transporter [Terracidiphilus sp.]|nr:MFS transporter [Terracidiphilus sp.]
MSPLYRKIALRLVPFLMALYFVAFLDRVNISFAALTMNRDLGIGPTLFGVTAGVFFFGYFLFELPSNLALLRVGARRWIMLLMLAWGLVSVATAFVHGPLAYIALRFLLGSAEAGFYPGVILYLTFWLPPAVRSRVMAAFIIAIPLSALVGSPISAQILLLHHALGLKGWQWLFILEGSPALLLGVLTWFVLPNGPGDVSWLSDDEKRTLALDLKQELAAAQPVHHAQKHPILHLFTAEPRVYGWSFAYFCMAIGLYGLGFWIPTVLKSHGLSLRALGWATAIPYLVAIAGTLALSASSDHFRERRWHLTAAYVVAALGFLVAGLAPNAPVAILGFSLAATGVLASMPVFWSASTLALAGPLVAAHIALINSLGNLGGFFGPALIGWLSHTTHSYFAGLAAIGLFLAIGALASARLAREPAKAAINPESAST